MEENKGGVFIVLEGADGSGKTTQFKLLTERLKAVGYDVEIFNFPRYEQPSSHFVRAYLNGDFGAAEDVSPYTASLFYALDRYEAAPQIRQALEAGKVVLCDRYVGSNMAHQGSKISQELEQRSFFVWEDSLEFQLLGIPRPNINLFLNVPAEVAAELISKRYQKKAKDERDEHEKNLEHLRKTVSTYAVLCRLFPKDFKAVEVIEKNKLLPITEINNRIWSQIKPLLPKPQHKPKSVTLELNKLTGEQRPKLETKKPALSSRKGTSNGAQLRKISLLAAYEIIFSDEIESQITIVHWPSDKSAIYIPERLGQKVAKIYKIALNKMADGYLELSQRRAVREFKEPSKVLRPLLPLASLCDIDIAGSRSAIKRLLARLEANQIPELHDIAKKIHLTLESGANNKVDGIAPATTEERLAIGADSLANFARDHLPKNLSPQTEAVSLLEAWPRNELDLLVDGIYPHSELPRVLIEQNIERLKYENKIAALTAAIGQNGPALLEQVHYKWDILAEPLALQALLENLDAESLKVQAATPRYGFETPEIMEVGGLEDEYQAIFDESLRLFSSLQAAGQIEVAPYATLLGHKIRAQFVCNAQSILEALRHKNKSPLLEEMQEKIAQVHPIIADALAIPSAVKEEPKKSPRKRRRSRRRSSRGRKKP